jgi:hypothetical protein
MKLIGFTGTSHGCTDLQSSSLGKTIGRHSQPTYVPSPGQFHHGGCVGADALAHRVAQFVHWEVHVHWSATSPGEFVDRSLALPYVTHPELPPLERNRVIVDLTDRLIACPRTMEEELRSGTWATIRYARKLRRPITLVWPNGTVTEERGVLPVRQGELEL